jgi:hypothetical protein
MQHPMRNINTQLMIFFFKSILIDHLKNQIRIRPSCAGDCRCLAIRNERDRKPTQGTVIERNRTNDTITLRLQYVIPCFTAGPFERLKNIVCIVLNGNNSSGLSVRQQLTMVQKNLMNTVFPSVRES